MQEKRFDYPFPSGVSVFWVFFCTPLLVIALILINKPLSPGTRMVEQEAFSGLMLWSLAWLAATVSGVVLANTWPPVRLRSGGVEVRFYLPFLTRWRYLPWDHVEQINTFIAPGDLLLREPIPEMVLYSGSLSAFYYIPMIIFRGRLKRGFIVSTRIKGHRILRDVLLANCPSAK